VVEVTAAASVEAAAFAAAALTVAGFTVAFVAVPFAAVGDAYSEPAYQGSAGYADQLIGRIQLRLARAINTGAIDGVGGGGTRRAIPEYECAHGLPEDGRIGQQLLTTMGLSYESPNERSAS
jgi:peptidoglycan hydrolase-like protein with peptidoglycan-binding domain